MAERPYATLAAIIGPAILLLVQRASDLLPTEVGAIVGPVGSEWWRYLTAPFVYTDVGYLFVAALAIAIFVPPLERRLGMVAAILLLAACGGLGMLAADGLDSLVGGGLLLAAGGNGVALGTLAAWFAIRHSESRGNPSDDYDVIGLAVIAAVLLALPLVDDFANEWAGVAGGLVGLGAGLAAHKLAPGGR